jgi:hypothetical protein
LGKPPKLLQKPGFLRGDLCAFCGFGTVVFFDELQVDIDGGVIAVIEFATVDAEELGEVNTWGVAMA